MPHGKIILLLISLTAGLLLLAGCMTGTQLSLNPEPARSGELTMSHQDLVGLPEPKNKILAAVYDFGDKTGQFKSTAAGSTNSRAVTQGATAMLIKALEDSGWFIVLEREGINNLINERKILDLAAGAPGKENPTGTQVNPLLYAEVLIEGGIIGYESNLVTGGAGLKYLGVGGSSQVRKDQVMVYLRAVSTRNGRILKTVYTTKTILSTLVDVGVYKYVNLNKILEAEAGFSTNEPTQLCVLEAIEKGVQALVIEGIADELWLVKDSQAPPSDLIRDYFQAKEEAAAETGSQTKPFPTGWFGIGSHGGLQWYRGDYPESEIGGALELACYFALSPHFSLFAGGGLSGAETEEFFSTTIYNLSGGVLLKLFSGKAYTPFLSLGGGAENFIIKDGAGAILVRTDPYGGWKPRLSCGLGWEQYLRSSLGLSAQLLFQPHFTDQIDGVISGNLPDFTWSFSLGLNYYPEDNKTGA